MTRELYNVNIESLSALLSPRLLKSEFPVGDDIAEAIVGFRDEISKIINHQNERLLMIVGPCSIHDAEAAIDYSERLKILADRHRDTLLVVMRVYFEKPRTSLGWPGFIVDPDLDETYNIQRGLRTARQLLVKLGSAGFPVGTEVLDPIIPQYIADLVSWAAIGARTTESQTHRELSSGLSMPVGFKNGTDGNLSTAVNAVRSARHSHSFIGINQEGQTCVLKTRGNRNGHIILRGGSSGPNYYDEDIEEAEKLLADIGVKPSILIDCSHANSSKDHARQARVFHAVLDLLSRGCKSVRGAMLESNINPGRQEVPKNISNLKYGLSITDSCIGWNETAELIEEAAGKISKTRNFADK